MVTKVLFRLARRKVADPVVRWCFGHLWFALPVRRVASTATVLAFRHPRPWRDTHVLLVPKAGIASLIAVDRATAAYVYDVLRLASDLCAALDPAVVGPRSLIVNGGAYQEVGQLHFHVIAGPTVPSYAPPARFSSKPLLETPAIAVFDHPNPERETHLVLRLLPLPPATFAQNRIAPEHIHDLVEIVRMLAGQRNLERTGYSLIVGADGAELDFSCFHLVAGRQI